MPASDVHDGNAGLGGGEAAGERGVGIAVDERRLGANVRYQRLERGEHASGLGRVRAAADSQLAVGLREPELLEEHARERIVVVLTGMYEDLLVVLAQESGDGGGLDELRAVADDGENAHGSQRSLPIGAASPPAKPISLRAR